MDAAQLATIGSVLGSEARAEIVCALMGGTAHTGVELSRHCGLARSTVSEHLGVLADAGIVVVEPQGRHRYFRLRDGEIAAAIEQLGMATLPTAPPPGVPAALSYARSCYDHLAGRLGVALHDALLSTGRLEGGGTEELSVTDVGWQWLDGLGIEHPSTRRPAVRSCLDWSERRTHLGGWVGAALFGQMLARGWLRRGHRHRVVEVTRSGRTALVDTMGMEI